MPTLQQLRKQLVILLCGEPHSINEQAESSVYQQLQPLISATEWAIISGYIDNEDLESALDFLYSAQLTGRFLQSTQFLTLVQCLDHGGRLARSRIPTIKRLLAFLINVLEGDRLERGADTILSSIDLFQALNLSSYDESRPKFWSALETFHEYELDPQTIHTLDNHNDQLQVWFYLMRFLYRKGRLGPLVADKLGRRGSSIRHLVRLAYGRPIIWQIISWMATSLAIYDTEAHLELPRPNNNCYYKTFINDLYEQLISNKREELGLVLASMLPLLRLDLCLMLIERKFRLLKPIGFGIEEGMGAFDRIGELLRSLVDKEMVTIRSNNSRAGSVIGQDDNILIILYYIFLDLVQFHIMIRNDPRTGELATLNQQIMKLLALFDEFLCSHPKWVVNDPRTIRIRDYLGRVIDQLNRTASQV